MCEHLHLLKQMNILTTEETAKHLRVSVSYLLDTVLPTGELKPIDNATPMRFLESDVIAYVRMDTQRRKAALKHLAEDEEGLLD